MKQPPVPRRKFLKTLIASGSLSHAEVGRLTPATACSQMNLSADNQAPPRAGGGARAGGGGGGGGGAASIDRSALVKRHNPVLRRLDPLSPLSIGNGEFAFTSDITGLQTFPREYENTCPLCTMSQWGWHTFSPPRGLDPKALRLTGYETHGRTVGYPTSSEGQQELFAWLRKQD